jgi:probable HAF family extracellular repeat protein
MLDDVMKPSGLSQFTAILVGAVLSLPVETADLPQYRFVEVMPSYEDTDGFPYERSRARAVNDSGDLVGELRPPILYWPGIFLYRDGRFLWIDGYAHLRDLNEKGQVVLEYGDLTLFSKIRNPDGTDQELPHTREADLQVVAEAINDLGQVAGWRRHFMDDMGPEAFIFQDGRLTILSSPASTRDTGCWALDINNLAQVTGSCGSAFIYHAGAFQLLGTLGGATSTGLKINDSSQVAGASATASSTWHAFFYSSGSMTDLGPFDGDLALNQAGEVAFTSISLAGKRRASLFSSGVVIDLGTLGGAESWATALNNRGEVVGAAQTGTGAFHAFVYRSGKMMDLGTLGRTGSEAVSINSSGQIAGTAYWGSIYDDSRAFLATPVQLLFSNLIEAGSGAGPGNSLANSLRRGLEQYGANSLEGTCAAMANFVSSVNRFTGARKNQVAPEQSAKLIADAAQIKTAVGCP